MEAVTKQLLQELGTVYKRTGQVTDEILNALQFVCGAHFLPALDLVDKGNVSRFVSPSGRSIYQVVGSSGVPYTCFTSCDYCSCPSYRFSVLVKNEALMCKHILAIRLSEVMGKYEDQPITDKELATTIQQMD